MIETLYDASNIIRHIQLLQLKGASKVRQAFVDNLKRTYKKRLPIHILELWEQLNLMEINDLIFSNLKYFAEGRSNIYNIQRMLEKNKIPKSGAFENALQEDNFLMQHLFRAYVTTSKSEMPWFEELVTDYVEKNIKHKTLVSFALHYGQEVYGGLPVIWKDWILSQLTTISL